MEEQAVTAAAEENAEQAVGPAEATEYPAEPENAGEVFPTEETAASEEAPDAAAEWEEPLPAPPAQAVPAPQTPPVPAKEPSPQQPAQPAFAGAEELLRELMLRNHYDRLREQAAALRETYPDFSLEAELRNPTFLRMTAPEIGIPVEDAYFAVHRRELQARAGEAIAREAERKVAAAVQSGKRRPVESGTGASGDIPRVDYAAMTPRQKRDFLEYARRASARGEKIYL